MAGFSLAGIEERIPCPHCGSTDCCGIGIDAGGKYLMCIKTGKRVTAKQLEEAAAKLGYI
uniref:Uncharacterized protein n=1 Tax=viral metagenome TaxID=1070528 RepID=A0A6M3M7W5_9ZZZZ